MNHDLGLFIGPENDKNWKQNKQRIESRLARGSVVNALELRDKQKHDRLDNQSVWLIVHYLKDGEMFKTIWSHKNNQYINIRRADRVIT